MNDGRLKLNFITMQMNMDSLSSSKSKIAFNILINNNKMRGDNSLMKWHDGKEKVTLTIWIKDNKIKYEYFKFSHIAYDAGDVELADILYET